VTARRNGPPRIVYLITSSGMGGAERQVRNLALGFRRRGWDVGVISMLPLEPPLSDLADHGIRTATLGMRRGLADPRGLLRLRAILRRWKPDVLHAHMVHANMLARLSRLVTRTPVVISTMHSQNQGRQWRYAAYRVTDRLSNVTTAVSAGALDEAVRRGAARPGRILLVPNGIDLAEYTPNAPAREDVRTALGLTREFVWLAVGRLVEAKDYATMIIAFGHVHDNHPEARLLIAGTGPLEQSIKASIRQAGLEKDVVLLGLRPDVPALMQAADGFVMSSAWEGLPMVLLEAAASGLPIISTDVGGSRDAVIDGVSGYIVRSGDGAALSRAMQKVMTMPVGQRVDLGEAGRAHAARSFDLQAIVETWQALYLAQLRRAAEGHSPPAS